MTLVTGARDITENMTNIFKTRTHSCEILKIASEKFWYGIKTRDIISRKHMSHFRPLLWVTAKQLICFHHFIS